MPFKKILQQSQIKAIANSHATARQLNSEEGKVHVVYNGLDETVFFPQSNRHFNEKLGLDPKTAIVGMLGVLARWKGQLEFIRMAKMLFDSGHDVHFVIIGDEIYDTSGESGFKTELINEVKKLKMEDRIHFWGFVDNSSFALNGLDILVHASIKPEAFGRVILEAMACALPVAASADGGVLELIEDGVTGLLFQPGQVEFMARQVSRLLQNPDLRQTLSRNALNRFKKYFTIDRHVDQVIQIYDEIFSEIKS